MPRRQPVGSPEVLASPTGWAIAGWEQLALDLSAGDQGLRVILVVLDAQGSLLSASDAVLYYGAPDLIHQESVGGRFEPDGSFRGTRWHSVAVDPGGDSEAPWQSTRTEPSAEDVTKLRSLATELIRRQTLR